MGGIFLPSLLSVALSAAVDFHGVVVEDPSQRPVASAEVHVWQGGVKEMFADLETDDAGGFTVPDVKPARYRVNISKANHVVAKLEFDGGVGAVKPMVIPLVRCGVISGRVTGIQGQPVTNGYVSLVPKPREGQPIPVQDLENPLKVDEEGRFRLYGIAPGDYYVAVSYGASTMEVGRFGGSHTQEGIGSGAVFYPSNSSPRVFTVRSGDDFSGVDLVLAPGKLITVSGRVEAAAVDKGRFWLSLTSPAMPAFSIATAQSDRDGGFRFEGVPIGSYQLLAVGPATGRSSMGGVLTEKPLYGRIPLQAGDADIEGIAITPEPGRTQEVLLQALPGCPSSAEALLVPSESWGSQLTRRFHLTAGRKTSVGDLAPSRYSLTVSVAGGKCVGPSVTIVNAAQAAGLLTLPMAPAEKLEGRLTGSNNLSGRLVTLVETGEHGPGRSVRQTLSASEGRFLFEELQPGRYSVSVAGNPPVTADIEVRLGADNRVEVPAPAEVGDR